jgi:hypothetical protein
MNGVTLLLAIWYLWVVNGQLIFLYPNQFSYHSHLELDAAQANTILSHHLRLDSFSEPYSKSVLGENSHGYEQYLSQVAHSGGDFVGRGLESAIIVNIESYLSGELTRSFA